MRTLIPLLSFILMLSVAVLSYFIYQQKLITELSAEPLEIKVQTRQTITPSQKPVPNTQLNKAFQETQQGALLNLKANYQEESGQGQLLIIEPEGEIQRLIFLFPGYTPPGDPYQQKPEIVAEKMKLKEQAQKLQALFVIPQMNTSIYEMAYYPGTKLKWDKTGNIPGAIWVSKVLPAFIMQKYALDKNIPIYTIGISTGAQGAIKFGLLNHQAPEYNFMGAIAISGTYHLKQEYAIHSQVLGNIREYPESWASEDLILNLKSIDFPVRLYSESNSIFTLQSRDFYKKAQDLKKTQIGGNTRLIPHSVHSWLFWGHPTLLNTIVNDIQRDLISAE